MINKVKLFQNNKNKFKRLVIKNKMNFQKFKNK